MTKKLNEEIGLLKQRLEKQKEASRDHEALIDKLNRQLNELQTNLDTALEANENLITDLNEYAEYNKKLINILDRVTNAR